MEISEECQVIVAQLPDIAVNKAQAAQLLGIERSTLYDYLDGVQNYLRPQERPEIWDWRGNKREPLSRNCLIVLAVLKMLNHQTKNRIYSIENLKKYTENMIENGLLEIKN